MMGPMFGPIRNVVFDLDGTLVETMPSIIRGLKLAVESGLGREVTQAELVATFGPPPLGIMRTWFSDEAVAQRAHQVWLDFERDLDPNEMRAFPGVPEMLEGLAASGVGLFLFTGRDRNGALRTLQHNGWLDRYFLADRMRCGDDGFPPKPAPEGLVRLLADHGIDPASTLMVGDHSMDVKAGRAAGTKTGAALWDLPPGEKTQRARFREAWSKWDGLPVDVRLIEPTSLLSWLKKP